MAKGLKVQAWAVKGVATKLKGDIVVYSEELGPYRIWTVSPLVL